MQVLGVQIAFIKGSNNPWQKNNVHPAKGEKGV